MNNSNKNDINKENMDIRSEIHNIEEKEKENNMKGLIHCHSENSRYDSAMSVLTLCEKAKEKGYTAVTLTDHGTLSGIDDFVEAAKQCDITPIPGVESYIQEDNSLYQRFHLILIAIDDIGYQGIGKFVTETNRRIDDGFPRGNKELIKKFFGPDSIYHGHVIATSACVSGVLAGIILSPMQAEKKIQKLVSKAASYITPEDKVYKKNTEKLNKENEALQSLLSQKDEISTIASQKYKKDENALKKLDENSNEYKEAAKALNKKKSEIEKAKKALDDIKLKISLKKKDCTDIKKQLKDSEDSIEKWTKVQNEIAVLETSKVPFDELYKLAIDDAKWYSEIFGKDNFYIEIQNHGFLGDDGKTEIESYVFPIMVKIAKELNLPLVAANDAHMPDGSKESVRARQIMNSIRYAKNSKVVEIRPGDSELYIKNQDELKEALSKIEISKEDIDEAIENANVICSRCHNEFKNGSHYPKFLGITDGKTADETLRQKAYDGIKERFPDGFPDDDKYTKRLEKELTVISKMGYSDYFLIVQDFLEMGRKLGKLGRKELEYLADNVKQMSLKEFKDYVDANGNKVAFAVGAGRGSAAGSLVAYLIGITNIIDPIKYDLLFERFLNEDRVSMPDVDSDFSPDIRELVVEYCKKFYGSESVANIMTKGVMAPKGAIRNVARVIGIEKNSPDSYLVLADQIAKRVPSKPGVTFADCETDLRDTFKDNKNAMEIIDQAKLVEGVFTNYGMHAAGVIIADGNPISDYVPLMYDPKSGDMKVQCNMVQAEDTHGLLKFDFLGLKNLKVITKALRGIKIRTGKTIDVENLPFDKNVFNTIFDNGYTGSVFQFESSGMKKLLKRFKPDNFEDIIALVSLYRPGPMDFIPQYVEAKYHPETIKYLCPQLESILGPTYGCIVYQEQVMEIFQKLAGYSLSGADNVRRFMSKKKHDKLAHEEESFINGDASRGIIGCVSNGIDKDVAKTIFDQMFAFASYAFNKSHAAAYAMVSYITAYLKCYFPSDYMCAVLNCIEDTKKMPGALNDCREIGIKILPPDINSSELEFSATEDAVMFGLGSVKGTKEKFADSIIEDRKENGIYVSFKDFLNRTDADKATIVNLIQSGAFDTFSDSRKGMESMYINAKDIIDGIKKKTEAVESWKTKLDENPDVKKNQTFYKKSIDALELLKEQLDALHISSSNEDMKTRRDEEREALGSYITSHPLDDYKDGDAYNCTPIAEVSETNDTVTIFGVIESLDIKNRKSDGKPMAFFTLEDKSGLIDICCFTERYEKFGKYLENGNVVKIVGKVNADKDEFTDEVEIKIFVDKVSEVKPDLSPINLEINDLFAWNSELAKLTAKKYIKKSGHPLVIYTKLTGEFYKTKYYISEEILNDYSFSTSK